MPRGKGNGPGRPKREWIGPNPPDPRRDRPDRKKPKCGASYIFRGLEKKCGKRGYHWKHGPGNG